MTTIQHSISQLASAKRILVLGPSGAGKSIFSNRLSQILNLPTIHLDVHFWQPGWTATPQDRWREIVSTLIQKPAWVMDGTYESTLDLRIPAADAVVMIESSRLACLWRVMRRQATVDTHVTPVPTDQKLSFSVLWRRKARLHYANWIRYIWRFQAVTAPMVQDCLRQHGAGKTLLRLNGSKEIHDCLRQLQRAVGHRSDGS